jgi:hypothetical protein
MAQAPKNPYKVVPIPTGYRRALPKEITHPVQLAAVNALKNALPIGKLQSVQVDGKLYAFVTEGHYDDHVTKPGNKIWHPGISTLVPITQPKSLSAQASDNLYAQSKGINFQSRVTGESGYYQSEFAGEPWYKRLWNMIKPPISLIHNTVPTIQSSTPTVSPSTAAALTVLAAQGVNNSYDAVHGDDIGEDDSFDVGGEFGDEFGASKRRAVFVARGNLRTTLRKSSTMKPSVSRSNTTKSDNPLGPSAPFAGKPSGDYVPTPIDNISLPPEETPETADIGSPTYDASAIGIDAVDNRFCIRG